MSDLALTSPFTLAHDELEDCLQHSLNGHAPNAEKVEMTSQLGQGELDSCGIGLEQGHLDNRNQAWTFTPDYLGVNLQDPSVFNAHADRINADPTFGLDHTQAHLSQFDNNDYSAYLWGNERLSSTGSNVEIINPSTLAPAISSWPAINLLGSGHDPTIFDELADIITTFDPTWSGSTRADLFDISYPAGFLRNEQFSSTQSNITYQHTEDINPSAGNLAPQSSIRNGGPAKPIASYTSRHGQQSGRSAQKALRPLLPKQTPPASVTSHSPSEKKFRCDSCGWESDVTELKYESEEAVDLLH
ncbi:hypothetical protein BDV26DRAFT_287441 [Aspergillus bertholletiae]|uniref:Uncharacterized protein n=1 Tax=Aspergillus bertholletiae TaxID=1226010 RepID=A0A5N7BP76_9EURO|nr:hypothetical protein BDV26DRAFT_287441 [Aspergillus bertholletiae]